MRSLRLNILLFGGCAVFPLQAHPQAPSLTRVNYETGIQYDEPVGKAYSGCDADDFGLRIRWGDDLSKAPPYVSTLPDKIDPPPVPCGVGGCVKGWHTFTTKHVFTNAGDYTAQVVNENAHCYGSPDRWTVAGDLTTIHVFPRVPLSGASLVHQTPVKSGQSADITISLQRSAPASGTRVFLIADKPELLDPKFPLANYIEFAADGKPDQSITLHISPDVKSPASLTVTAQAGGPAKSVIIDITP